MDYENDIEKNESTYWLFFELLWRDFFKYVSMQHRNKFFSKDGIYGSEMEWSQENAKIKSWINGETKETFVNAIIIEAKNGKQALNLRIRISGKNFAYDTAMHIG